VRRHRVALGAPAAGRKPWCVRLGRFRKDVIARPAGQDHLAAFDAGCAWCGALIPAEYRAPGRSSLPYDWAPVYEDGTAKIIHVLCPEHAQMVDEFGAAEPT
jgi:hypothetical protein